MKKQFTSFPKYRPWLILTFWMYTFFILWQLFIGPYRTIGPVRLYNVVPFKIILYMFEHYADNGGSVFLINIVGNIAVFIPFGLASPTLWPKLFSSFQRTLLIFFILIFIVEVLQYVLQVGVFDVDDLLLNSIGIAIGYFMTLGIEVV
jgi:glycopeptide antibiotics resistance protein